MLLWGVISKSLVAYLAQVAPKTALLIDSDQPTALLALADGGIDDSIAPRSYFDQTFADLLAVRQKTTSSIGADGPPPATEIDAWTEKALIHDPLNAQAIRILGQLAESQGDETRALRFMQAAARNSLRESVAIDWLMRKDVEKSDYVSALYYADALLRTRPQLMNYVVPILARMAEDKTANPRLKELLVINPPWRVNFFSQLPDYVSDARTPLDLLLALKDAPVPPTTADLRTYLNFLIARKFYQLAYNTWLQFLSRDRLNSAGLLYNGNFEIAPSGLPFDWAITPGTGVTVGIGDRQDGAGHALVVTFEEGRVDFQSVMQLIVLPPGAYRLTGKYKGEISGPRGMKWRVTCASGAPIAESKMMTGMRPQWVEVEIPFAVPTSDCAAQYVRLDLDARMASERFVSGSMSFDELAIAREPGKP